MNKPWVRVLVQVGLGLVLASVVLPLLSIAMEYLSLLRPLAELRRAGTTALVILTLMPVAVQYLLAGTVAAWLSWLIERRPWDALGACALVAALHAIANLRSAYGMFDAPVQWRWMAAEVLLNIVALFVGTTLVAWLLQRRIQDHQTRDVYVLGG